MEICSIFWLEKKTEQDWPQQPSGIHSALQYKLHKVASMEKQHFDYLLSLLKKFPVERYWLTFSFPHKTSLVAGDVEGVSLRSTKHTHFKPFYTSLTKHIFYITVRGIFLVQHVMGNCLMPLLIQQWPYSSVGKQYVSKSNMTHFSVYVPSSVLIAVSLHQELAGKRASHVSFIEV